MNYRNEEKNNLEELINGSMSISGMVKSYERKALVAILNKAKNDLGFTYVINGGSSSIKSIPVLEQYGIFNLFKKSKINRDKFMAYGIGIKVSKLDQATYLIVFKNFPNENEGELTLYFFGRKSFKYYNKFRDQMRSETKELTTYNVSSDRDNSWSSTAQNIPCRDFSTLYFDDDIIDKVKKHLDTWIANKETYESRGLNFKTGILFHGIPGTGKTSIASAIATYLNCDMITIDASSFHMMNTTEITAAINADSKTYVVLLDEVDIVFRKREEATDDESKKTTNKLLQFLDGSTSPTNVVFVATTNYYDNLDAAVKRKGRFDKEFLIDNFSHETAMRMCKGFGLSTEQSIKLLAKYKTDKYNPATLQADILEVMKGKYNEE